MFDFMDLEEGKHDLCVNVSSGMVGGDILVVVVCRWEPSQQPDLQGGVRSIHVDAIQPSLNMDGATPVAPQSLVSSHAKGRELDLEISGVAQIRRRAALLLRWAAV